MKFQMIRQLAISGIIVLAPTIAFAWASDCGEDGWCDCPGIRGGACLGSSSSCEEACGMGSGGPVNTGPTAEEIKQQKEQAEQKDLDEAAQDADDKGTAAYERGDWENAVKYLKEALEYAPDDGDIRTNLDRAQHKLNDARSTESARQLQSIAEVSKQGLDRNSAQVGFDTGAPDAGSLTGPTVNIPVETSKDPVVPDSKRTPAITALEEKRIASRDRIKKLDETLKTLDPGKDSVKIAQLKQEKSNFTNQVHYLNFSIGSILDKPAEVTPSK